MQLRAGDSLGRYRIDSLLGAGGMGAVYRAKDTRLERPVAIKVLSPDKDASRVLADLLNEARSASALNHPNVCTIYEVGEEDGCAFIAMEYVEGVTLDSLISKCEISNAAALEYALQIADALSHAHEQGVIHGDLKTANILVTSRNRIKIVDFGLSRRYDRSTTASATAGVISGTPHAMAPEQLRGGASDTQSDVWSFGIVLFEMLCGCRPFNGATTLELATAILHDPPAPVSERVPVALRHVVERCLSKEKSRRFRGGLEAKVALETAIGSGRMLQLEEMPAQWSISLPPALGNVQSSSVTLVGRTTHLSVLQSAMDRARTGRRQFAFVAGEAGIGKTRLTSEFARSLAPTDVTVLFGRCDSEALIPYQPFVEALDWYVRSCPGPVLRSQLEGVEGASELVELIPSISRRFEAPMETVESNPEGRRYRLFEATASFLAAASRTRPLLVLLEDVHWADRPTLLMLRHLLRSSHEGALCFVATYRETELDRTHPLGDLLADLRREPVTTHLKLQGLDEGDIARFVQGWVGSDAAPSLVKVVATNTEGNPLFIGEVLRHLDETGKLAQLQSGAKLRTAEVGLPEGVRQLIGRRVSRLSEDCRRVLAIASVVGRDFTFGILQAIADLSEDRLLDVIDEGQSARVIQNAPGSADGYTFTHALIRETLYGDLTAARRVRLHRKVAEALEQSMKPGREPLADLAYHFGQAASSGEVEKAVAYAVRAGEAAAARFAVEEAARFNRMALQSMDLLTDDATVRARRFDLHVKSGKAFASVGQWGAATAEYRAALSLLAEDQRERRAELLVDLSIAAFWLLDLDGLRAFANEAVEIADAVGRDDLWANAMASVASAETADGQVLQAVERDRRAIERAGGVPTLTMARSAVSLYHAGLTQESILRANQALESARAAKEPAFIVYSLSQVGLASAGAGKYSEAQRAYDEARTYGRRYGVLPLLARAISMSTGMHVALGNLLPAETLANEARELARQVAFAPALISAGVDLLVIYLRTGEIGRAEGLIDEVSRAAGAAGGWHGWLWRLRLLQVQAELALARGDYNAAAENARKCVIESRSRHRLKYEALASITNGRALFKLGETSSAIEDAARSVTLARRLGDPSILIEALSALLQIDGNDALLAEARSSIESVRDNLSDEVLRARFLESETVRSIMKR